MVIELKNKYNELKIGSIYATINTIDSTTSKLTRGTPVKVVDKTLDVVSGKDVIVEDYRGEHWQVKPDDISGRVINEIPKTYSIFKCNLNIYQIIDTMYKIFICILLLVCFLIFALKDLSVIDILKMIIPIFISAILPHLIVMRTDNIGNMCLFAKKKNIEELQILLNKK